MLLESCELCSVYGFKYNKTSNDSVRKTVS